MRRLIIPLAIGWALVLLAAQTASPYKPEGKLVVELAAESGQYEITAIKAIPGSIPPADESGPIEFRLYDKTGTILSTGRLHLPEQLVHERADEDGDFQGYAGPITEPLTVLLPYYSRSDTLEFWRDGDLLLSHELDKLEIVGASTVSSLPEYLPGNITSPDFRGFLSQLERQQQAAAFSPNNNPSRSISPTAKKIRIRGTVRMKGVRDSSKLAVTINFHPYGGGDDDIISVKSRSDGRFKGRLQAGKYLVRAFCYYYDPAVDDNPVPVYPFPILVTEFDPSRDKQLDFKWKHNKLFRGRLVNGAGTPIFGRVYVLERSFSGATSQRYYVTQMTTDREGEFAIRLPGKLFTMIALPAPEQPAGELLTIVKVRKTPDVVDLVCPSLDVTAAAPLNKIWDAGPESNKLNLVFLAEAYTSGNESFTDSNGNGIWDGDLLLDENGNGIRDNDEYFYDRNFNRVYDEPESFVDENGDRICNRNERAKFEADSAINATALLNFSPFDEFTDSINVYTYWTPSQHGTQRFTNAVPWNDMVTAFGVYCSGNGAFQSAAINTDTKSYALNLLPGARELVPIVMTHDPMNVLRANAGFGFGRVLLSAEDSRAGGVMIHELGHSIGNLWDEYIYDNASGTPAFEPSGANATIVNDPGYVKWSEYIVGSPPVPTPTYYDGYGLFEGAGSYTVNVFRPTSTSMMRSTSYPFFKVNSRRIREVLSRF